MNRKQRRIMQKQQHEKVGKLPERLTRIPPEEFPIRSDNPAQAWQSRHYLVQLYPDPNPEYPELIRLSVSRTRMQTTGRWQDGITWDELQNIKREVGYGGWYGMEIYPPDHEEINVQNMRHLWLLPKPLSIGWFGGRNE